MCSHSFPYSLLLNVRTLTPWIPTRSFTCHKTQSQTNRHPSVNFHSRRRQILPPPILLLCTCALTSSVYYLHFIDRRFDKVVPHPYSWIKFIYTDTQSAADPLTEKAAVNNWPILLAPSVLVSPIISMSRITWSTRWYGSSLSMNNSKIDMTLLWPIFLYNSIIFSLTSLDLTLGITGLYFLFLTTK